MRAWSWGPPDEISVVARRGRDITALSLPCRQVRARDLTRTQLCWHPDLRLPASRTVRNKSLLFIPPSLCFKIFYYILWQSEMTSTFVTFPNVTKQIKNEARLNPVKFVTKHLLLNHFWRQDYAYFGKQIGMCSTNSTVKEVILLCEN